MRDVDEDELPPGARLLDRYTILDRYDGGGMATIYRARDERLARAVAVKVLRTTVVGDEGVGAHYRASYAHFLREAQALSRLQHPSTLRIYDFGYAGRAPFYVSELLAGGNLEGRVRKVGHLSPAEALDVLERVAGALVEAHGYGIVHRDVKPANILFAEVSGQRFPKLADFGIARTHAPLGEAPEAEPSAPLCSPRWAAPEQLSGGVEGPATDVYALGLVLYFMLAGAGPFDVPRVRDTFVPRILDDAWVTRAVRASGLGGRIEDVLLAALRVAPAQRFRGPLELAAAARAALAGAPPPPDRPPPPPPPPAPIDAPARDLVPAGASGADVRVVRGGERVDLAFTTESGETRLRLTFQPDGRVHVKPLSGFVRRGEGAPTSAVVVEGDAALTFVGADRAPRLSVGLSRGARGALGTVFVVGGRSILVPSEWAVQAVALFVADTEEVVLVAQA